MRLRRFTLQTLDAYVLKRFASIYAASLFSFTLIFVLIDTITHYDKFAVKSEGIGHFLGVWFQYYTAMVPVIFCQILGPVVAVSASLFSVTTHQRNNEFIPILATGRSCQRTLFPILVAGAIVSVFVFLVQDLWIPETVKAIRKAVETVEKPGTAKNIKHFDRRDGNLIVFKEYDSFQRHAEGVLVLPVLASDRHQFLIQASAAEWIVPEAGSESTASGYWILRNGWVQEWDENHRLIIRPPPEGWSEGEAPLSPRLYETFVERRLETTLIPQDIERQETAQMSLADLSRKAEASPGQHLWTVKYYSRFAYAAMNFTLVLLGLPVIVFFGTRNIFVGALLAVGICTTYFVINSVFQDLGVQGHLPAPLGAGLAPILFISLGATLYRQMRS